VKQSNFTFSFLVQQIRLRNNILILTHVNPDGDAIGSMFAMRNIIIGLGKNPTIFFSGKTSCNISLEENALVTKNTNFKDYDLILIVDTNNPRRTGIEIPDDLNDLPETFIIDHHIKKDKKNKYPNNIYYHIVPGATATSEIIFDLLKESECSFSKETAYYLLLGLYTDSGGFFHSNTTPALLKKTKELLKMGVLFKSISQKAFKGKDVNVLAFLGDKITQTKFNSKLNFVFNCITENEIQEKNLSSSDISGLVNIINMCKESLFSLILVEEKNLIKGSIRSHEHKNTDVSHISRFLGGGGHRLASGFEVDGKLVETNKQIIIKK